jgi:hypothetical protein
MSTGTASLNQEPAAPGALPVKETVLVGADLDVIGGHATTLLAERARDPNGV